MGTSALKAWAGALSTGLLIELSRVVELNDQLESALAAAIAFALVWFVKNYMKE